MRLGGETSIQVYPALYCEGHLEATTSELWLIRSRHLILVAIWGSFLSEAILERGCTLGSDGRLLWLVMSWIFWWGHRSLDWWDHWLNGEMIGHLDDTVMHWLYVVSQWLVRELVMWLSVTWLASWLGWLRLGVVDHTLSLTTTAWGIPTPSPVIGSVDCSIGSHWHCQNTPNQT